MFAGGDACVAPVLSLGEASHHPHNAARATFTDYDGVVQPAPAPRFSRTAAAIGAPPRARGADCEAILRDWGFETAEIDTLQSAGVIGAA